MQRIPICAFAICLLLSLFLVPPLFAQNDFEQFDYRILGEGTFTIETSALEKGKVISWIQIFGIDCDRRYRRRLWSW